MSKINFQIILDRPDDRIYSIIKQVIKLNRDFSETSIEYTHFYDYPAINCVSYVTNFSWPIFFIFLKRIKSHIEEKEIKISQIIIYEDSEILYEFQNILIRYLSELHGFWLFNIDLNYEQISFFETIELQRIKSNLFYVPFNDENDKEDDEFEKTYPTENFANYCKRINGTAKRQSVPIGLRIMTVPGRSLNEYISNGYSTIIKNQENLGGRSVIITTLLQMNEQLQLVNHYSEKLDQSIKINLYSLKSMNLVQADEDDETSVVNLVKNNKILISNIKLGV